MSKHLTHKVFFNCKDTTVLLYPDMKGRYSKDLNFFQHKIRTRLDECNNFIVSEYKYDQSEPNNTSF